MTLAYPALQKRSFGRKVLDTVEGYVRIDLVEERMFPATSIMRYLAVVFPVLLYYFQVSFLGINERHHSLAICPSMNQDKPGLVHVMVEVDSLDAVGQALDRDDPLAPCSRTTPEKSWPDRGR